MQFRTDYSKTEQNTLTQLYIVLEIKCLVRGASGLLGRLLAYKSSYVQAPNAVRFYWPKF